MHNLMKKCVKKYRTLTSIYCSFYVHGDFFENQLRVELF